MIRVKLKQGLIVLGIFLGGDIYRRAERIIWNFLQKWPNYFYILPKRSSVQTDRVIKVNNEYFCKVVFDLTYVCYLYIRTNCLIFMHVNTAYRNKKFYICRTYLNKKNLIRKRRTWV